MPTRRADLPCLRNVGKESRAELVVESSERVNLAGLWQLLVMRRADQ